jgi:hypothetical protein
VEGLLQRKVSNRLVSRLIERLGVSADGQLAPDDFTARLRAHGHQTGAATNTSELPVPLSLAAVGFDPVLHQQETRAAFQAEHSSALAASSAQQQSSAAAPEVPVVLGGVAHLVLICVHAHNRFVGAASMERIRGSYGFPPTALVSLPCCHVSPAPPSAIRSV